MWSIETSTHSIFIQYTWAGEVTHMRHGVYLQISTEQVLIFKNLLFLPQTNSESKDAGLGIRDLVFGFSCTAHCSLNVSEQYFHFQSSAQNKQGVPPLKLYYYFVYMPWSGQVCTYQGACVVFRGQLCKVYFLFLPLNGLWGLNSGPQACRASVLTH